MARPTRWERSTALAESPAFMQRWVLAVVAEGETITRVRLAFQVVVSALPTALISAPWFAGVYVSDNGVADPSPNPAVDADFDWLWWTMCDHRMYYDDPTSAPANATTTEVARPPELAVDIRAQRLARDPLGMTLRFAAAPTTEVPGWQGILTLSSSTLVLEVA